MKAIHFPGLNGLRAFAAVSVITSHFRLWADSFGLAPLRGTALAEYGVSLFFVLSGYLITYLLLAEKAAGDVAIKPFYIRRILRIWPLYFIYLLLACLYTYYFIPDSWRPSDLWYYLLFSVPLGFCFSPMIPPATHYWSLSVEEQFYIIWPWLIKKSKRILPSLVGFLLVFGLLKILVFLLKFFYPIGCPYNLLRATRFDCMAIGGMLAYAVYSGLLKTTLAFLYSRSLQILSWVMMLLIPLWLHGYLWEFDHFLYALFVGVVIVNVSTNPSTLIKMEGKVLNYLGKISFGLYVYHLLLISVWGKCFTWIYRFDSHSSIGYILAYLSLLGVTILVAHVSYFYFERPFLKMKEKFTFVPSES